MYFDGGPDLRTPVDNPVGVLDSMGVVDLLNLPGSEPELAGLGTLRPLLTPDQVCFFGQSSRSPEAADATVVRIRRFRLSFCLMKRFDLVTSFGECLSKGFTCCRATHRSRP